MFLLASKPDKVFRRESILSKVWGTDVSVVDRTIDVHIRKIREKVGEEKIKAGRLDEKRSEGITESLSSFGFRAGRLKTGTPPRIKKSSVDWSCGLAGYGDKKPRALRH